VINSALYREPTMLDANLHRHKKLKGMTDYSVTKQMHAAFLTATEFPQAAMEMPIIFINTGERLEGGKAMVSPVALLGLTANENLRVGDDGQWLGRYVPAFIRRFPFLTAGIKGSDQPGVFVDAAWSGFSDDEGEALFDEHGKPTEVLQKILDFLQRFEDEQQRTRMFCQRLVEIDVLKEMQADATMPDGQSVKVEGFLVVDEEKLHELPDKTVLELHRNGMLMLMQSHLISMGNIRDLVERKAARMAAAAQPA
jgi:hypothetical protein